MAAFTVSCGRQSSPPTSAIHHFLAEESSLPDPMFDPTSPGYRSCWLDDDLDALRDVARAFCEKEIKPNPHLGSHGQATFIIPSYLQGFKQHHKLHKYGIRALHTAEVKLDDVRTPGRLIVGAKEKFGDRIAGVRGGKSSAGQAAMMTFGQTRNIVGAMALGVGGAALAHLHFHAARLRDYWLRVTHPAIDTGTAR
jgi:hypothetical protein